MKPEFKKVLQLFEEFEEAGESATLTISSRKGVSTIKLMLESPPTLPTTQLPKRLKTPKKFTGSKIGAIFCLHVGWVQTQHC